MHLFKKEKPDWPIFLLGFVTVGVLMTAAIVALIISKHVQKTGIPGTDSLLLLQNPEDVSIKYQKDMRALMQSTQASQEETAALFDRVEATFFAVHVPYEMRDTHIVALRQFQALRVQLGAGDDVVLRAQLVAILQPLTE